MKRSLITDYVSWLSSRRGNEAGRQVGLQYTHEKTGIRYDAQILFTFQVICQSVLVNNEVEHH